MSSAAIRRQTYGDHLWVPETQADWSRGMIRDTPRIAIPPGAVYDSADYLLHQPGIAQKRGGTSYAGPAMTSTVYAGSVSYAEFTAGSQLAAIGVGGAASGDLFTVTAGATTDKGGAAVISTGLMQPPIFRASGTPLLVVVNNTSVAPAKYDGTAAPSLLSATAPAALYGSLYKTRLVLGNTAATSNRLFFSPTPDITGVWDTANSWLDATYAVSGIAALNNVLLVFSRGHMERVIGSTPPPNTDMDLAPVAGIGCTDARSIVISDGYCYFANPRGVYVTNGTTPISLTKQGGIETYWQSLFSSYDPSTWFISAGMLRSYLFVCVLDNSRNLIATLMCNVQGTRGWWRLTNLKATMFATATGVQDELYYADASTNRVVALSGIFNPAAGNKNDANGTAVTPSIEFAPFGQGTGVKSYAFGHLNYDMRDAASDNPTMAVTVKTGLEADTSSTPAESPLPENSTTATILNRPRFTVNKDAQSVTIALAQSNASSKTELYAVDVESRGQPLTGEGVS